MQETNLPNLTADWEIPQRQSPAAIFILFIKTIFNLAKAFWPVLLIYVFREKEEGESNFILILTVLGFGLLSILITLLKFWFYKFSISGENLHIQSGWWKRKKMSIPLKNIQSVQLEQDLWQRIFKVSKVSFDSAGSDQVEARIDALEVSKAEKLKEILLKEKQEIIHSTDTTEATDVPVSEMSSPTDSVSKVYRLDGGDLLKLSLSANHFEAFFILLAFGYRFLEDLGGVMGAKKDELMQSYADEALNQSIFILLSGFALIAGISIVFSAGRTLFKYYDFKLVETEKNWKVSWGLTTRQQKIVPFSKIQMLTYQSNWLRRKLDFWMIYINVIGQVKTQAKTRITLPFTSLDKVLSVTSVYLSSDTLKEEGKGIAKVYWIRKAILLALPLSVLVSVGLYFLVSHYMAWLGIILLGYLTVYFYIWQQNFQWIADESGLWLCAGVWGRKYTLLKWQKIQQIELRQTLYQYRKQFTDIHFITAGGVAVIPYLKLETAQRLRDEVLYLVESKEEDWL